MDADFKCANDYWTLIPDSIYEAQCFNFDEKFVLGKSRKLFLNFKITQLGEHYGKQIFQAFNMPYNRKIKTGSKYYKTWCLVNGWQQPSRNAKMSPRLFLSKVYRVRTRTAKPLYNGKPMPEKFWYSVVDEIVEVIAK